MGGRLKEEGEVTRGERKEKWREEKKQGEV